MAAPICRLLPKGSATWSDCDSVTNGIIVCFQTHTFRDSAKGDFQLCGFSEIEGRRRRPFCDRRLGVLLCRFLPWLGWIGEQAFEVELQLCELLLHISDSALEAGLLLLPRVGVCDWSFFLHLRVADVQVRAEFAGINAQVVVLWQPTGVQQGGQIVRMTDLAPAAPALPAVVAHGFSLIGVWSALNAYGPVASRGASGDPGCAGGGCA